MAKGPGSHPTHELERRACAWKGGTPRQAGASGRPHRVRRAPAGAQAARIRHKSDRNSRGGGGRQRGGGERERGVEHAHSAAPRSLTLWAYVCVSMCVCACLRVCVSAFVLLSLRCSSAKGTRQILSLSYYASHHHRLHLSLAPLYTRSAQARSTFCAQGRTTSAHDDPS